MGWKARFDIREKKLKEVVAKMRSDAKEKTGRELEKMRTEVVTKIKAYLRSKPLTVDQLFEEFNEKKDGKISEPAFVKILPKCQSDSTSPQSWPSEQDLPRVFKSMDEEGKGFLTKDDFSNAVMDYMKVVKEIGITDVPNIQECKTVRKLELKECIKVLEGPVKDDKANVSRVRAKALKDGVEGWITVESNQGTTYLKEGGGLFKVLKETILTGSFDIGAAATSVKDTSTHKLKAGEVVEVREWPKKDESGLLRLKCRL